MSDSAEVAHAQLYGWYAQRLARSKGGSTETAEGLLLADGFFSSPFRNVMVAPLPLGPAASEELEERGRRFFGRPSGWTVWTYADEDLREHGFVPSGGPCVVMTRDGGLPVATPTGGQALDVRKVTTDDEVTLFEEIRERANGRPFDRHTEGFLDGRCLGEGHRMWLGRVGQEPVAAAACHASGGTALLLNVSVVPSAQRGGFGTTMSVSAMASGGRWVLHSRNPAAIALYRRLGFEESGRLRIWEPDSPGRCMS